MNDMLNLQYSYTKVYAAVTEELSKNKEKLSAMVIGGGGYVYPRYLKKVRPGSRIDVVEIDPAVTNAAMEAFGLERNTTINTINVDARNYVDKLFEQKRNGNQIPQYDFIYEDAINDYSVPFQLVTQEFNDKISELLSNDGVYMINMIDIFDSGLFLGSVINTLEKTFPHIYVVADIQSHSIRNTFIIISAKRTLDLKNILSQYKGGELKIWYLDDSDINMLKEKTRHLILTDNYCPVENLLAPVVLMSAKDHSAEEYFNCAQEFKDKKQFAESIKNYLLAIKENPTCSIQSYNEIGIMYAQMGNPEQAIEAFNKAIEYNDRAENKTSVAIIHSSLGILFQGQNKSDQAMEQFRKAVEGFQEEVKERPAHHESWRRLGDALAIIGDLKAATEAFKKALSLNPDDPAYYANLARALEFQERYTEEIEVLKNYIQLMKQYKQDDAVLQLQKHLESLEYEASKGK